VPRQGRGGPQQRVNVGELDAQKVATVPSDPIRGQLAVRKEAPDGARRRTEPLGRSRNGDPLSCLVGQTDQGGAFGRSTFGPLT